MLRMSVDNAVKICPDALDPESELDLYVDELRSKSLQYGLLQVTYAFREYWKVESYVHLTALYLLDCSGNVPKIRATVSDAAPPNWTAFSESSNSIPFDYEVLREIYSSWSEKSDAADVSLFEGWVSVPVYVPKPWGREVWYTGIENRGVAHVSDGTRRSLLPWVLSVAPRLLTRSRDQNVMLVKVLEPFSDPLYGNLYYELHPKKQEVYIVTDIDEMAWPDVIGEIKLGVNQTIRRLHRDDKAFRRAFIDALRAYQAIRNRIDSHIQVGDRNNKLSLASSLTPKDKRELDRFVPMQLKKTERDLRRRVDMFFDSAHVSAGSVVKVPPYAPHAVQHGVRCLGFQTQHYDRLIFASCQKVLTQKDWDIEEAVATMLIDSDSQHETANSPQATGSPSEPIAVLEELSVCRMEILSGTSRALTNDKDYCVLCLRGSGAIDFGLATKSIALHGETVLFVPRSVQQFTVSASSHHAEPLTLLMGFPNASAKVIEQGGVTSRACMAEA